MSRENIESPLLRDRGSCQRDVWVSPALFAELSRARVEVSSWQGCPLSVEVEARLRLWPDTGWSLAERIILAETVWMDAPFPEHGGGLGRLQSRLDHWLALADERFSLREGSGAVEATKALGTIEVHVDRDGSFEPYTLRLPDEKRVRNPSIRVLGAEEAG
tara:strand:+ start:873 stop:1355 length:483 start_codon:yes stop_codon:yes gene_type:complete